jgi:O-antigen/teichoic acid export membrane protein
VKIVGFRSYLGLSFIAVLAYTVLTNIDVVLVKHFLSSEQAGNYAAIAALGRAALFAPMGIALAMFPKVSGLHEMGKSHRPVLLMAVLLTLLISGTIVVIYWIAPQFVIGFLGRDEFGVLKYALAVPHLSKYALAMILFAVSFIILNYLLSINRIRIAYPFVAAAFLEVVLILYFHGDIAQVVNVMLVSAGVCLIAVIAFYMFWVKKHAPPIQVVTNEV